MLHPQFPANLLVWKVQSVDFFRYKAMLDVGSEIAAASTATLLEQNWPWLLALFFAGGPPYRAPARPRRNRKTRCRPAAAGWPTCC